MQTATRAEEDGADIELIVAALIHDIGDDLAPENHSQMAAAIIRPYVRAEVTWILEHHGIFQMVYYADKLGLNKDERERYRGHKWFDSAEKFCGAWDQASFDPAHASKPLSYFAPMVEEIFSRPAFSPAIIGEPESQTDNFLMLNRISQKLFEASISNAYTRRFKEKAQQPKVFSGHQN